MSLDQIQDDCLNTEKVNVECVCLLSLHVQALLGLGGLILGAVAYHGVTVRQVEVECDQRAVLHAQSPQGRAVNL